MNFQWYPGHMTKAKRQMQEDIKLIDLVIELVDARIPLSSRNPDIDELGKNKYRLILMNKADLADRKATEQWSAFFKKKGYYVVSLDARSKNGMKSITEIIMEACKEKMERDRKRGIKNRPVRAMVVGIPNVGKSTFSADSGNDMKRVLADDGVGIFAFTSLDDVAFASKLLNKYSLSSTLYKDSENQCYYLSLTDLDDSPNSTVMDEIHQLLSEYCKRLPNTYATKALFNEHLTTIIEKQAVEEMAAY